MAYNDGISKINSYSLTDFHDFDECIFRFLVRHTLDRKYDIDEGSPQIALGNLLDQSIKKFHKFGQYGCTEEELTGIVYAAANDMMEEVAKAKMRGKPHFYQSTIPFLTPELIAEALEIFKSYYRAVDSKIKQSLGDVGFCEWILHDGDQVFKIWGGPDTLEMGDDGIPEVVDYKSRQNLERGKATMDMDLMPKIYTLLCTDRLLKMGHTKARFVVRFWQDPMESNFVQEFDLENLKEVEDLFLGKIKKIIEVQEFSHCNGRFCGACNSSLKDEFISQLQEKGYLLSSKTE